MKTILLLLLAIPAVAAATTACSRSRPSTDRSKVLEQVFPFQDARAQAAKFIGYHDSIKLSSEQEKIKESALSTIPAPCCGEYSIATCCCPCNLAKSVWGLSHYLIAKAGFNTEELRQAVSEWIQFTNPGGYTGDACHNGGCKRPFEKNGCGGMDAKNISLHPF